MQSLSEGGSDHQFVGRIQVSGVVKQMISITVLVLNCVFSILSPYPGIMSER